MDTEPMSTDIFPSEQRKYQAVIQYTSPYNVYGLCWSTRSNDLRLAVTSLIDGEYKNKIQILKPCADGTQLQKITEIDHPYPPSNILWAPEQFQNASPVDHIATTADYLRIWNVTEEGIALNAVVSNKLNHDTCAPLTSFDWNESDPAIIGTSSIDTTCTIWDLNNTSAPKQQIIAHDTEVYDMAFSTGPYVFGSVGQDGSLRVFDLRSLETSNILYESEDKQPLLRIAWNKLDSMYMAAIPAGSTRVVVLDLRKNCPVFELDQHSKNVNSIDWSKHSRHRLVSAAEDFSAIVYDLSGAATVDPQSISINSQSDILTTQSQEENTNESVSNIRSSILYQGTKPIDQIRWCPTQPNCLALTETDAVRAIQV